MSAKFDEDTIEIKNLDKLLKALKPQRPAYVKIGVLGNSNARSSGTSNAEIGAVHEFGAPARNIKPRSFLRMPLTMKLNKELTREGAFSKDEMRDVIKLGSIKPWLEKVAAVAKGIVLDAFATGGFGEWPAWKDPNYQNNSGMLLVDTTQLRNSIDTEVVE